MKIVFGFLAATLMALPAVGQSYDERNCTELVNNETGGAATIRFLGTHFVEADEVISLEAVAYAQAAEPGNRTTILPVVKRDDKVYRTHDEYQFDAEYAHSVIAVRGPGTFVIDTKSGNSKAHACWVKVWACPIP